MAATSNPVGPTAHYTGYVWSRNGLSHPELETTQGRLMFEALQPVMRVRRLLRQGSLEDYLLARHLAIDKLLERAIERHGVSQVIEMACGLSPRGWRFAQRYGADIVYIETDLPDMAARKRAALERMGALSDHHQVVEADVLAGSGPRTVGAVMEKLDRDAGLAVISEGLIGYLPRDGTEAMWRRLAEGMAGFPTARHICHIHLRNVDAVQVEVASFLLSLFVRTRVRADYPDEHAVERVMRDSGFASAKVHSAPALLGEMENPSTRFAHVVEAVAKSP